MLFTGSIYAQENSFDSTIIINNRKFIIKVHDINKAHTLFTITCNTKIILADTLDRNGLWGPEFIDFNKDGKIDIQFTHAENNPIYSLYLFDPVNNTFKNLEGFESYPDAIPLKSNPKYSKCPTVCLNAVGIPLMAPLRTTTSGFS